jgi:hypothetical protein
MKAVQKPSGDTVGQTHADQKLLCIVNSEQDVDKAHMDHLGIARPLFNGEEHAIMLRCHRKFGPQEPSCSWS